MTKQMSERPAPKEKIGRPVRRAAGNTALAPSATVATTCTTAATTSWTWPKHATFEEIAYLLVHGKLPTRSELDGYKQKLKSLRGLPGPLKTCSNKSPPRAPDGRDAHRLLGAGHPAARERRPQHPGRARHRGPADRLLRLDAAVLVPLFATTANASRWRPTTTPSAGHFLHLLHGKAPSELQSRAPWTSR